MTDWWSNPLVYIVGAGTLGGAIYGAVRILLSVGEWKGRNDGSVSAIKEAIQTIQGDIKSILERLPRPEVVGDSPLRLTDFGRTLSEGIGGHDWAQEVARQLADNVQGKEAYEVQDYSFEYAANEENHTDEFLQKMRICAYNNGTQVEAVRRVLGVELRDALLEGLGIPEEPDKEGADNVPS